MPMHPDEFLSRLKMYFTPGELADFLGIDVESLVYAYEDLIFERKQELLEEMGLEDTY